MKHLQQLLESYVERRHPGQRIVESVMRTSNSPEFIVGVARAILASAELDLREEKRVLEIIDSQLTEGP